MKKVIFTEKAPAAIGPYSQAVEVNGMVFLSGQIPVDPATGEFVPGGVTEQTTQVFENIKNVLAEAGLTTANIVKTTVFLADMSLFAENRMDKHDSLIVWGIYQCVTGTWKL
mgnify:FL=1